jgi:subtilisin-like proprotein convertase family protein
MLEANPDLTWRDVQEILVRTAQVYPGAPGDRSLTRNGAGRIHSNRYGFGIINANRSVAMSENWVNIGPERSLVREGKGSKVIIDDRKNVTKMSLYVDSGDIEFVTETVYLYVKVKHSSRGHLRVDLRSPSNTLSVMSPGERPEDQQKRWMKFTSVRYWGEDPNGQWNIRIIDTVPGTASDCIDYDDYRFQYFNEDEDQDLEISCDSRHAREMSQFCSKGALNPTGLNRSCYEFGLDSACERMERFETTSVNNRTAFEACCACGGGFSPETLPETVVEWKIVVYGRKKSTMEGWFSGVGNDVKLGRWGERGVVREGERFRKPEGVEAITGAREMFGGGVRGRNRRD